MRIIPALIFSLALTGCATHPSGPIDSMRGHKADTELRLATAASEAIAQNRTQEALDLYKKLYGDSPDNKENTLNYAQLLRKTGQNDAAANMLKRYISDNNSSDMQDIDVMIMNEYAATQIQAGSYDDAQKILDRVIEDEKLLDFKPDAYNLKGIALDAAGDHRQAESMFRKALETWKGDSTSVMNNLALSLASQGMFDDALTMLRKALAANPSKKEIANNIDLISNLRDAVIPKAPVNIKKPGAEKTPPSKK